MKKKEFPLYKQKTTIDCGPTCLQMIIKYYNKKISTDFLFSNCKLTKNGVTINNLAKTAELIGFKTLVIKLPLLNLINNISLPVIAHWSKNHFIVIYKISSKKISVADPAHSHLQSYSHEQFADGWVINRKKQQGIILNLESS